MHSNQSLPSEFTDNIIGIRPEQASFPLPVHICAIPNKARNRDVIAWSLVLVRRANRYYALMLDTVYFDSLETFLPPGASGARCYPRARSSPHIESGWVWRGIVHLPCSERHYDAEVSKLARQALPFTSYLKEVARAAIENESVLSKVVYRSHQDVWVGPHRELRRRAFLGLRTSDKDSGAASIWNLTATPPVVSDHEEHLAGIAAPMPGGLMLQVVAPALSRAMPSRGANKDLLEMLVKGVQKRMLPNPDPSVLAPLYERFPNFHEALDKVSKQLHLLKRSGKEVPLRLRPLLLVGGSGVGKSHFAWQLAKTLGAPAREVDFATATAGFVLAGSSPQWADAKHGMVFDELINGPYGNPVFIGNEIDKSAQDGVRFPPVGPLYTLLEPETAHRFIDEFAETALDASYVCWVLTANDLLTIPGPLLLRMDVVTVPPPTPNQLLVIGQNIYRELLDKAPWGPTFPTLLGDDVLELVASSGTPRQMRNALLDALGQAAMEQSSKVRPEHIIVPQAPRRSIGF